MLASQNGHVEMVDKLLQHGAKVDLQVLPITATIPWVTNESSLCVCVCSL